MKLLRCSLLAALFALSGFAAHAAAPAGEKAQAVRLLSAIAHNDFASFVAEGDAQFRQMPRDQFAQNGAQLAPRLNGGYEIAFLGELKKEGFHVTLWKLTFADGKDDALFVLSVQGGRVGGFNIE
jgi:opacity protein-like surface antigen